MGVVWSAWGILHLAYAFSTAGGRITAIEVVRNPQKLGRVAEYGIEPGGATPAA